MTLDAQNKRRLIRLAAIHVLLGLAFLVFTELVLPRLETRQWRLFLFSALCWGAFLSLAFYLTHRHIKRQAQPDPDHFWDQSQEISLPALKRTMEDMQLGVTVSGLTGNIIYANPAEARMHGYVQQELTGRDIGLFVAPDQRHPLSLDELKKLKRWSRESVNITKDGKRFPVWLMSDLILDHRGRPAAIVTTCQDISERKQIEQDLVESEQKYRQLVESAHEMILGVSPQGRLTFVNQAWLAAMGYSWSQSQEMVFCDTVDGDSMQLCHQAFSRVMSGVTWHNLEINFIAADGRTIVTEGNLTPQYHLGKVIGVLGVFRDVTQKKAVEELLRRSENHYRMLIKNVSDMILVLEADGTIRYQSPSVEVLTGFLSGESKGRQVFDYINPEDLPAVEKAFKASLKLPGPSPALVLRLKSKQGQWLYAEAVSNNLLDDPSISGIVVIARDITGRRLMEQAIMESEVKHRLLLNSIQSPVLALKKDMTIYYCNQAYSDFVGRPVAELEGRVLTELFPRFQKTNSYQAYLKAVQTGQSQSAEGLINGQYLRARIYSMDWGILAISEDVTAQQTAVESVKYSEERFRLLADSAADAIVSINQQGRIIFWNKAAEKIFGHTLAQALGQDSDMLIPERFRVSNQKGFKQLIGESLTGNRAGSAELCGLHRDGHEMPMEISVSAASVMGQAIDTAIIRDITERRNAEEQLKYLSFHDALTGLYNRAYFEEEMQRLSKARLDSVGLLICDVDGLKLVNDTMGHKTGDGLLVVIAGIITDACRQGDVVARIGGDEFAAILPDCTVEVIEKVCSRIRQITAAYNSKNPDLPLSLSLGWVVRPVKDLDPNRLFHSADDEMYREKVKNHEMMVNNFIQALQKKNLISEEEIDRMGDLMKDLAKAAGLKEKSMGEMEQLARYHDIGNVLVSENILLKAGHLDRTEEEEMKRHCEIGYHIVMSTPHLMPHAEWILKHHERWDGQGYPQGLQGAEIPLESRIVALAAAYIAMRQKRPHAQAMTHQQALEEIKKESGRQFDPELVSKFLKLAHKWKDLPPAKI
jgi:diguanylate cyclase (GGDEF)-like protein/PAS domain S-box-containing protein